MLQYAMTGRHPQPMPARDSPWAIYDVFTVKDGEQIFLAAVSDAQWLTFCDVLGFADLKADPLLATNNDRVKLRPQLLATLRERLGPRSAAELARSSSAPACPSRRSASPKTCTTTRTCTPPAAWPTSYCPTATRPARR